MADLIGTTMVESNKSARQIFEEVMANPARKKFGFGNKLAIVNVDVQQAYDPRCEIDAHDLQYTKRMPSSFFETQLASYLTFHRVDTVVVTGGSTSGCVRATAVDALSYGYRTIVPIETCADKHESYHFANLTDLQLKYADVEPVQTVIDWLEAR